MENKSDFTMVKVSECSSYPVKILIKFLIGHVFKTITISFF